MRLLEAGADPNEMTFKGCRAILGFPPESDDEALVASSADFHNYRTRRFGKSNPEVMNNPFWDSMIRSGVSADQAQTRYGVQEQVGPDHEPTWCADRLGQSITFLPDGRIVQIAGEHEDYYDPDFCIYNDVFVHNVDDGITIYGYPEEVFPPTDFHSATLIGDDIYIIGSLGYSGNRQFGTTQVYRLNTQDFRMERLETTGDLPGWIHHHRAALMNVEEIRIWGGKIARITDDREVHVNNEDNFVLNVRTLQWRSET